MREQMGRHPRFTPMQARRFDLVPLRVAKSGEQVMPSQFGAITLDHWPLQPSTVELRQA